MRRALKVRWAAVVVFSLVAAAASAGTWNTNSDGVVLNGYDAVAYHTEDSAVRGSVDHSVVYDGVTFYFTSDQHKKQFEANPADYVPAFGGYCAFAMGAKNAKVGADPRTFKVHDGRLLVFFNDLYEGKPMNTKILWNAQEADLYERALGNWTRASESE